MACALVFLRKFTFHFKILTMKLINYLILGLLVFTFACEGPPGPRGPEGPSGRDGKDGTNGKDGQEAYTFDFEGIDFTTSNSYMEFLSFPDDFEMLTTDVALVYMLWDVDDNGREIWLPLPQTFFLEEGTLLYTFDFTTVDISVFLDANFNLDLLGADWTDNWVMRVVVVPSLPLNGRNALDVNDYHSVIEHFGLTPKPVDEKYKSIKRPQL